MKFICIYHKIQIQNLRALAGSVFRDSHRDLTMIKLNVIT